MKVLKDFRNNLLKRREIVFSLECESNPGFLNVQKTLVENIKVPEENVVIKSIKNNFGSREFVIEAFVYDSKSDKERIEPKKKVKASKGTATKTEVKK